jgi:hypothetical protein
LTFLFTSEEDRWEREVASLIWGYKSPIQSGSLGVEISKEKSVCLFICIRLIAYLHLFQVYVCHLKGKIYIDLLFVLTTFFVTDMVYFLFFYLTSVCLCCRWGFLLFSFLFVWSSFGLEWSTVLHFASTNINSKNVCPQKTLSINSLCLDDLANM